MPADTMPEQTSFEAAAHDTLVASMRNAHALEKQQITVLESQLDMLTDIPELHARLTEHIVETRDQARRLEAGLEACGSSASMVRDALLSVMGLGQSSVQGFGDDAVLKAVLADIMEEHLEIATYRTLLLLADMAGKPELRPRLEETLREEEAMAAWLEDNLEPITRRFIEVKTEEDRPTRAVLEEDAERTDEDEPEKIWETLEKARTGNRPAQDAKTSPTSTANKRPRQPKAQAARSSVTPADDGIQRD